VRRVRKVDDEQFFESWRASIRRESSPIPIAAFLFARYALCRIVSHQGPFVECELEICDAVFAVAFAALRMMVSVAVHRFPKKLRTHLHRLAAISQYSMEDMPDVDHLRPYLQPYRHVCG